MDLQTILDFAHSSSGAFDWCYLFQGHSVLAVKHVHLIWKLILSLLSCFCETAWVCISKISEKHQHMCGHMFLYFVLCFFFSGRKTSFCSPLDTYISCSANARLWHLAKCLVASISYTSGFCTSIVWPFHLSEITQPPFVKYYMIKWADVIL